MENGTNRNFGTNRLVNNFMNWINNSVGAIMFFNVWFVIWPNQKKALGIVEVDAETKASSARTAMLFSRTNTLLSIPMLFCMVAQQNFGF